MTALARALYRKAFRRRPNEFLSVCAVLLQILDDFADSHCIVLRMPAIVVGDECDSRVADFRLARELRFLEISHADQVGPPTSIRVRFSNSRELGTVHADVCSAALYMNIRVLACLVDDIRELRAYGMRE